MSQTVWKHFPGSLVVHDTLVLPNHHYFFSPAILITATSQSQAPLLAGERFLVEGVTWND